MEKPHDAHRLNTPVAMLVFRRPQQTARVLEAVRQARPRTLLVAADAPRPGRPDEAQACARTRALFDQIDWDCQLITRFHETNLGAGVGPATGISWVFEQVPEAIILEDDCVPDPSFFRFCAELLERYRDDPRVMQISGTTYRAQPLFTRHSYVFSQFPACWGWACWRRAWRHFDQHVPAWGRLRQTPWLSRIIRQHRVEGAWACELDQAWRGHIHTWDFQWAFACWLHQGLSIRPRHNLITNIGHGHDATHTHNDDDPMLNLPTRPMRFPLHHPPRVKAHRRLDRQYVRQILLPDVLPAHDRRRHWLRRAFADRLPRWVKDGLRGRSRTPMPD